MKSFISLWTNRGCDQKETRWVLFSLPKQPHCVLSWTQFTGQEYGTQGRVEILNKSLHLRKCTSCWSVNSITWSGSRTVQAEKPDFVTAPGKLYIEVKIQDKDSFLIMMPRMPPVQRAILLRPGDGVSSEDRISLWRWPTCLWSAILVGEEPGHCRTSRSSFTFPFFNVTQPFTIQKLIKKITFTFICVKTVILLIQLHHFELELDFHKRQDSTDFHIVRLTESQLKENQISLTWNRDFYFLFQTWHLHYPQCSTVQSKIRVFNAGRI